VENCGRPAIVTKDLSVVVVGREARSGRSLRRALFGSRAARADRIAGLYELSLHRALEPGTSTLYYPYGRKRLCSGPFSTLTTSLLSTNLIGTIRDLSHHSYPHTVSPV
jgi:hypothetical protein